MADFKTEEYKFKYEENKKIYLDKEKTYNKILFALVLGFVAFKLN